MPITKSAKKANKRSLVLKVRNLQFKRAMKQSIKDIKKAVGSWDKKWLDKLLQKAYSAIDKAQRRNIVNKNNAARKKSRLTKMIAKV